MLMKLQLLTSKFFCLHTKNCLRTSFASRSPFSQGDSFVVLKRRSVAKRSLGVPTCSIINKITKFTTDHLLRQITDIVWKQVYTKIF